MSLCNFFNFLVMYRASRTPNEGPEKYILQPIVSDSNFFLQCFFLRQSMSKGRKCILDMSKVGPGHQKCSYSFYMSLFSRQSVWNKRKWIWDSGSFYQFSKFFFECGYLEHFFVGVFFGYTWWRNIEKGGPRSRT